MRVYFRYALKETFSQPLAQPDDDDRRGSRPSRCRLSLVGSALLLKQSAAQASAPWQQGTRVTVWMQPTASAGEISQRARPSSPICRS